MGPRLYSDLTSWYRLIDPVEDHLDEAEAYGAAFARGIDGARRTLLELGAGAGHNAFYLKRQYACTLADISEPMQALSRALNPDCEHVTGDMRALRLDRTFDAVFVHDAVMYMTTEADVLAMARTAWAHTRAGGATIVAPDYLRETLRESTEVIDGADGTRALRCLAWTWDPDPADTTYAVEYACLLRDGGEMQAVHDRHVEGIFAERDWHRLLAAAGFEVETIDRPIGGVAQGETDRIFLCRKRPA
jgi:SAM-dependent methyltransferase